MRRPIKKTVDEYSVFDSYSLHVLFQKMVGHVMVRNCAKILNYKLKTYKSLEEFLIIQEYLPIPPSHYVAASVVNTPTTASSSPAEQNIVQSTVAEHLFYKKAIETELDKLPAMES